jgi:hypothetical protein
MSAARPATGRSAAADPWKVAEAVAVGCALGLLITRPRWGIRALSLLSGRPPWYWR